MKNKNLEHFFSIHKHSYKHAMHLFDIVGKGKDQGRKSKVFQDKPSFLKRIRRSIVVRINIRFENQRLRSGVSTRSLVFLFPSLRFRSRASTRSPVFLLQFRSGASTRNLVFLFLSTISFGSINPESRISYDSVREYQPGVSFFPTIS